MMSNAGNDDTSSTKPRKHSELKKFVIASLIYIFVATIFFYFVIHHFCGNHTNRILEACYFAVVLMTSSGYTDLTPKSNVAIAFAIIFAILGIGVFGVLTSVGADQILTNQLKPFTLLELAKNHEKVQYSSILIKYVKVLAVWLAVHMFGGIFLLVCNGKMHFFRSVYCVSSTITTVISSDECFSTEGRRTIALIWILDGMIVVSAIVCLLTELWTQSTKWLYVKKNLERKPTLKELQKDDFDEDDFIRLKGYSRYRLKEIKSLRKEGKDPKIKESGRKSTYQNFTRHSTDGYRALPSFKNYIPKLANSDDIRVTSIVCAIYMGFSIVIFYAIRYHLCGKKTNGILDAIYFSFVIMTSVGYGDLSPNDTLAKIFASIFSLSGLCVIGKVVSTTLNAINEKHIDKFRKLLSKIDRYQEVDSGRKESIMKKLKIKVVVLVVIMFIATPIVLSIEDLDFIHALYCTSITITSSGTQKCFSTIGGRGFALLCMLIGAIYKGWVFFIFTEVYIEEKQRFKLSKRKKSGSEGGGGGEKGGKKVSGGKGGRADYNPPLPLKYGGPPGSYPPPTYDSALVFYPLQPMCGCRPDSYLPPPPQPIPMYGGIADYDLTPMGYAYPPQGPTPDSSYPYPELIESILVIDQPMPDDDPIPSAEEMVIQEDEKYLIAIEKEFEMLDVGRTGRLTLDEVMKSQPYIYLV